jgi:hypothetical protein
LHAQSPQKDTDKPQKAWYRTLEGWKKLLEIIAIPFAIAYAVVTFFQWRDSNNNFIRDERAWVEIKWSPDNGDDPGHSHLAVAPGSPASSPLKIMNIGKTAAKNISEADYVELRGFSDEVNLSCVDTPQICPHLTSTTGIMFPSTHIDVVATRMTNGREPRITTLEEANAWMKGQVYIAVFGKVTYDDVFGVNHWTKFCFWGNSDITPLNTISVSASRSCTAYNAVDDNR